jgi:hypothetical protein
VGSCPLTASGKFRIFVRRDDLAAADAAANAASGEGAGDSAGGHD